MAIRILLVQTDRDVTQALVRHFTQRGDEVWRAWDLEQAYALIEQARPDLLLMDLQFDDADWSGFIARVRQHFPAIRWVMTNTAPALEREKLARQAGIDQFISLPQASQMLDQVVAAAQKDEPAPQAEDQNPAAAAPDRPARAIRMPVRVKITLPYLFLALLFALASAYIVSQVALESVEDRFLNQLIAAGRQSSDWMVREENRLLETLRVVANTQGVASGIQSQDAEALRLLVLPVAVNSGEEVVVLLDAAGTSVLSLLRAPGSSVQDFAVSRGDEMYRQWSFVQLVAAGTVDQRGDKFSGIGSAAWGDVFYVSGPVMDADGSLVGIALVGKSLRSLSSEMNKETFGDITLYDRSGLPVVSTLFSSQPGDFHLSPELVERTLAGQEGSSLTRDLRVSTVDYTEILGPWETRGGEDQGILGIALAQSFLVRTSQATQLQIFVIVAASILLVLFIGFNLAGLITRPLLRLVSASREVAQGNLDIKVDAQGDDEVAVLSQSFNYMVQGLQEGSIYRDLLGRTVSPQVREQLRQTFNSGDLRLEGQQAVAAVIMSDIRGFTTLSEQVDPATVFKWLNEYFTQIVPIVAEHGGVANKFDGDAMLAFFGILPRILSEKESASAACQAALEILQVIDQLNCQRVERGDPPLITGIGVHTGVVISGGLGSSDRMHYTIIGDTVNTTQRIESLTRQVMDCSGILVSRSTFDALVEHQKRFRFLALGWHSVKGKTEQIEVFQLLPPDWVLET